MTKEEYEQAIMPKLKRFVDCCEHHGLPVVCVVEYAENKFAHGYTGNIQRMLTKAVEIAKEMQ